MNIILIFLCIIAFIILYFCFGILLSFLIGWWPIIIYFAIFVIFLVNNLSMALYTIPVGLILILVTNLWQGTTVYLNIIERLDKKFYFND